MAKKKERELTKAEQRRKENFEQLKVKLEKEGYQQKNLTISVLRANVMALVLSLPFIILAAVVFFQINSSQKIFQEYSEERILMNWWFLFLGLIVLAVVHEGLHGITWGIFAPKHFGSIEFGFIAKYLTPYCCCMEPLKKWQYILGGLMPTVILGVIPIAISCFTGSIWWFFMGCIMFMGGGGDMEIVRCLLMHRSEKEEQICLDHPYECGVVVFER